MAADGVGAREWVEMDGEKKPLGMSEFVCSDGSAYGVVAREWLEMGGEKKLLGMSEFGCAAGCGQRGCKGVAGNGCGEEAAGDERAWLRGRLRTAWVQGSGWKWVDKKKLGMSELGCADGCGRRRCKGVAGNGRGRTKPCWG